jgi:hypothetical protein
MCGLQFLSVEDSAGPINDLYEFERIGPVHAVVDAPGLGIARAILRRAP